MTRPWHHLTGRGRALLIGGLVVTVASLALGQHDLAWFGLLLLVLPLLGLALVLGTQLRMTCRRRVDPARCPIGTPMSAVTELDRKGGLPVGILRFEESVPPALGPAPRFAVHTLAGSWHRRIGYELVGSARGRFEVGPLLVRACDPFGTAHADHAFTTTSRVMVTPRIEPLGKGASAAGAGRSGESTPHRVGLQGADDVLIREYRDGDDLRRVHWRSTARRDELMVRREEQAWDPSVTILLDTRASRHGGSGPQGSFEWAVSAAASVADHMVQTGFRVMASGADGPLVSARDLDVAAAREACLLAFTDVALTSGDDLDAGVRAANRHRREESVVAVLGRLTPGDVTALDQVRAGRPQGLALVLDVDDFTARRFRAEPEVVAAHLDALDMLSAHGWRTVPVNRGMTVAGAWAMLDRVEVGR